MLKKFIFNHCVLLATIWSLIILGLCSFPGQYIPSVSWLEMLSFDKWVHAGIFFILCSLLFIIAIKKSQSFFTAMIYFACCIVYGGLLEIMQAKVFSHRGADWQDFAANSFGALVSLLFIKQLRRMFKA